MNAPQDTALPIIPASLLALKPAESVLMMPAATVKVQPPAFQAHVIQTFAAPTVPDHPSWPTPANVTATPNAPPDTAPPQTHARTPAPPHPDSAPTTMDATARPPTTVPQEHAQATLAPQTVPEPPWPLTVSAVPTTNATQATAHLATHARTLALSHKEPAPTALDATVPRLLTA